MLHVGLNPYGLGYTLGRQGAGTLRANPHPRGLAGLVDLATELGASLIELPEDWVTSLDAPGLDALRGTLRERGLVPVLSTGLQRCDFPECARVARRLGATLVRMALSSVLCGDRAIAPGGWDALVASVSDRLAAFARQAEAAGLTIVIENHQDFTSRELAAFCELLGPAVRIVFDTGNAFPVAEAPLQFTRVVAPFVGYLHLKDYRVQPTGEGFRLVRCALGDGAVPFAAIAAMLAEQHPALPAALELAALEARHVRLLTPGWWQGYAPVAAPELAACLLATRPNALAEDADYRTPWERGDDAALQDYELDQIRRSAANLRTTGLMGENRT